MDSVNVKPGGVFLWAGGYFGILLLCAFLDVAVWRKLFPGQAHILSLATETVSFLGFVLLLDRLFPQSSQGYEESLSGLRAHPVTGMLRVCLLAPAMEELLTRGILLGGLREAWGWPLALAVSAGVFALLHFNLVQTLSALVCGLVLGLLYLCTGSLLCCFLAHAAYNLISMFFCMGA